MKNQNLMRRWKNFISFRRGAISLWILLGLLFISFTAEFWANDRPLILFYKDKIYFPVVRDYSALQLGLSSITVQYKSLELSEKDWALGL